jgi:hypothetical protein
MESQISSWIYICASPCSFIGWPDIMYHVDTIYTKSIKTTQTWDWGPISLYITVQLNLVGAETYRVPGRSQHFRSRVQWSYSLLLISCLIFIFILKFSHCHCLNVHIKYFQKKNLKIYILRWHETASKLRSSFYLYMEKRNLKEDIKTASKKSFYFKNH